MNLGEQNTNHASSKEGTESRIRKILDCVYDPEIPVLSVTDLGIIREVNFHNDTLEVVITPTYSGCPAMDFIGRDIRKALLASGFEKIKITERLSPAWTTDWITEEGKNQLLAYGIAPPQSRTFDKNLPDHPVPCPHCHSTHTELVSQFGSTACKALYRCRDCGEPFDYFKCH